MSLFTTDIDLTANEEEELFIPDISNVAPKSFNPYEASNGFEGKQGAGKDTLMSLEVSPFSSKH